MALPISSVFSQVGSQRLQSWFTSPRMVCICTIRMFFQKVRYLDYEKNYFSANRATRKSQVHYLNVHKIMDPIFSSVWFCWVVTICRLLIVWYGKLLSSNLRIMVFFTVWGHIESLCDYKFLTFLWFEYELSLCWRILILLGPSNKYFQQPSLQSKDFSYNLQPNDYLL